MSVAPPSALGRERRRKLTCLRGSLGVKNFVDSVLFVPYDSYEKNIYVPFTD